MARPRSTTVAKAQDIVADAGGGGDGGGEGGEEKSEMINRCLVYCRLRPNKPGEIDAKAGTYQLITLDGKRVLLDQEKSFDFDGTFGQDCVNYDIYLGVGKPAIDHVMKGYKAAILAYGQTGTGKSYTMSNFKPGQEGVIPNAVKYLLTRSASDEGRKYKFEAQFVQIYRDALSDLMSPDGSGKVDIRFDAKDGVSLPGCTTVPLETIEDFEAMYTEGDSRRVVRATLMNPESSRGHTALVMHIHSEPKPGASGGKRKGKIVFIDLAGYERFSKTGISNNPVHKDEAKTINASLCSLGHVVSALSAGEKHVPWRNAKLTRLLQDSIGGTSRTTIMITLGPSSEHMFETSNTLEFGMRAMAVKVAEKLEENVDFETLAKKLKEMLAEKEGHISQLELAAEARKAEILDLGRRHKKDMERLRDRHKSELSALIEEGPTPDRIQALLRAHETENEVLQDQIDLEQSVMQERHLQEDTEIVQEVERETMQRARGMSQAAAGKMRELREKENLLAAACRMIADTRGGDATAQDVEEELRQVAGVGDSPGSPSMSPSGVDRTMGGGADPKELEELKQTLEKQEEKSRETIDKMKRAQVKLAENMKRIKGELAEAKKGAASADDVKRLQGELEEMQQSRAAAQAERDGLQERLHQAKAEHEQQLQQERAKAQQAADEAAARLQAAEERLSEQAAAKAAVEDRAQQLERSVAGTEAQLKAAQTQAKKRQARVQELEEEIQEVREEYRRRDRERTAAKEDQAAEGARRVDALSDETVALRKRVSQLESEAADREGELSGKTSELEALRQECDGLLLRRRALERELEEARLSAQRCDEEAARRWAKQQREMEDAQQRTANECAQLRKTISELEAKIASGAFDEREQDPLATSHWDMAQECSGIKEQLMLEQERAGMAAVLEEEVDVLRSERDTLLLELKEQSEFMDLQQRRIDELEQQLRLVHEEQQGEVSAVLAEMQHLREKQREEKAHLSEQFEQQRRQHEERHAQVAAARERAERQLAEKEAAVKLAASQAQDSGAPTRERTPKGQHAYRSELVKGFLAAVQQVPVPPKAPPVQTPQHLVRNLSIDEVKQALRYRVVIIGGEGVGKSSLQRCLCTERTPLIKRLPTVVTPSLGLGVRLHTDKQEKPRKGGGLMKKSDYLVTHYQVWDTPCDGRFLFALPPGLLPVKGSIFLLCYDLTRDFEAEQQRMAESLSAVVANCQQRLSGGEARLQVALVGTRLDLAALSTHQVQQRLTAATRWFGSLPTAVANCTLAGTFVVSCKDWTAQSDIPDGPATFPQLLRQLGRQLHRSAPNTPPALLDDDQGYGTGASLDLAEWWELSRSRPIGAEAQRAARQMQYGVLTLVVAIARLRQRARTAIGAPEFERLLEEHFGVHILERNPGLPKRVRDLLCDRGLACPVADPAFEGDANESVLVLDTAALAELVSSALQPLIYITRADEFEARKPGLLASMFAEGGFFVDKVTRGEWEQLLCGQMKGSLAGIVLRRSGQGFAQDRELMLGLLAALGVGQWVAGDDGDDERVFFTPCCAVSTLSPELLSGLLQLLDRRGGYDASTLDSGPLSGAALGRVQQRLLAAAKGPALLWGDAVACDFGGGWGFARLPRNGTISVCCERSEGGGCLSAMRQVVTDALESAGALEAACSDWSDGLALDGLEAAPAHLAARLQEAPEGIGRALSALPPELLHGAQLPDCLRTIHSPLGGSTRTQWFRDPAAQRS